MAKRQVFISFHYSRDVWRAGQVRSMGKVDNSSTFCDNDWEEVREKSDAKIKEWIDSQLQMRSCLVVLVGNKTSERKWVKYEIERAYQLGRELLEFVLTDWKIRMASRTAQERILFIRYSQIMDVACQIM